MSLLTLFRKMLFYWFMWKFRGDCSWAKASLNRSVSICQWRLQHPRRIKAIIFKMVTTYVHYIRTLHTYTIYVHYIRTLCTHTLLGRLSFSRFSLAIQTLATEVSLGEEKKSFILIFSFVIMAVNCCKIHHFSLMQRIIDEFLA